MLGAFKKFLNNGDNDDKIRTNVPSKFQLLDPVLQKKYSKGINYNMKIIIKGDKNVGKSCLFSRLQGQIFVTEYLPTTQINTTNINWNYKNTDTIVKVEIWDVADSISKSPQKKSDNLKLNNIKIQDKSNCNPLNSDMVDVYKNTNGLILMLDITKKWTLDYIKQELSRISNPIPILILANKRDLQHKRVIDLDEIIFAVNECENNSKLLASAHVKIIESSMKNNFGMKYIHKFFNLPFLELQRDTLIHQLAMNSENIQITLEELRYHAQSFEQNYDYYLDQLRDGAKAIDKSDNTFEGKGGNFANATTTSKNTHDVKNCDTSVSTHMGQTDTNGENNRPDILLSSFSIKTTSSPSSLLENDFSSPQPSLTFSPNANEQRHKTNFNSNNTKISLNENACTNNPVRLEDKLANFVPQEVIDYSFFDTTDDDGLMNKLNPKTSNPTSKIINRISSNTKIEPPSTLTNISPNLANSNFEESSDEENGNTVNPMVIIYPEDLDD